MKYARAILNIGARVPRGLTHMGRAVNAWRTDAKHEQVYQAALDASPARYLQLRADRDTRRRRRTSTLILIAALAAIALILAEDWAGPIVWQTLTATVLTVALSVGRSPVVRQHPQIINPDKPAPPDQLTPDTITKALTVALPTVAKAIKEDPKSVTLHGPVIQDGPGWAARVNLPLGATVEDVVRARVRVASGLQIPVDRLYLDTGIHAGQVDMWVANQSPAEMPMVEWVLAGAERIALTDPLPIGLTPRGKQVPLSLRTRSPDGKPIAGGSMLVGGVSGSGKTTFIRMIIAAAALDPNATIAIFDGKGDHDYRSLAAAADWYRVGANSQNLADLKVMLEQAQEQMTARQNGEAPKHPLLIVIDEVQRVRDKEIQALIEDLARVGRSAGIFLVIATQKPSGESLPTDLRDSIRTRVCLRVPNQQTNDMILGTGAYTEGRDASKLSNGMALVLDVDTDAVTVVRLANVTDDIAARIAAQHSRTPGRIFSGGVAESATAGPEPVSIVDRVREVWPAGEDRASCAELAAALAGQGGEFWGWEASDVTESLKPFGIETKSITLNTINPDTGRRRRARGIYRADLDSEDAAVIA